MVSLRRVAGPLRTLTLASAALALAGAIPVSATLIINPIFNSSIDNDANAAAIKAVINSAIQVYETDFSDPITVSINFGEMDAGLGASSSYFATVSYATYYNKLVADATSANDTAALARLAVDGSGANNPVTGSSTINVKSANLRALGLSVAGAPPFGQPDGFVTVNTSITDIGSPGTSKEFSLLAVVEHEIDEVLGLGSGIDAVVNNVTIGPFAEDLFRYDSTGARSYTSDVSALSYFSINGATDLASFNQSPNGDYGDWASGGQPQVQDAFGTVGAFPTLGANELTALDVIGYNSATPEPSAWALMAAGCLLVVFRKHRSIR